MSGAELVSPGTRLSAADWKATNRPLPLIDGNVLGRSASAGPGPRLTRVVVPSRRSRTKMSVRLLVSAGTRLVASELKATNRPSPERDGAALSPLACPAGLAPTRTRAAVLGRKTEM